MGGDRSAAVRAGIRDERYEMAALGVEETERVMDIIDGLRARGLAVLLVSHNLEHVFRVTDRIAVMHRGVVSAVLHRGEVTRAEVVALIMGSSGGSDVRSSPDRARRLSAADSVHIKNIKSEK